MIPRKLILKNFLSYREATLNFQGLHTACICGANGAGKSSLLEAISWAIWGQSRANSEDDVIHLGAAEAQVDFIFTANSHTYRILRSRQRGQTTVLEFQVAQETEKGQTANGKRQTEPDASTIQTLLSNIPLSFRSLTAKGVRATQQLILEHLKLDYETFINSAYLRQGRADEFMLKRPAERKEILADLLKLDQYEELTERAKDRARQLKGKIELLQRNLDSIQNQLQQQEELGKERAEQEAILASMQDQQTADRDRRQLLQAIQQQRQTWQQELTWQQQQQRALEQDCQRLQRELQAALQQRQDLETILHQEEAIAAGYAYFQSLQTQEEWLSNTFKTYQALQTQRQQYQQQHSEQVNQVQRQVQQVTGQLDVLEQQEAEIQQTLSKTGNVEAGMQQLQQARAHLTHLDHLQTQVTPLLQRQQQLQTELDRVYTRLTARLEELHASAVQLQLHEKRQVQLQQAVLDVRDRAESLEQRRLYQQQILEKGLERRGFMEHLQADQRNYEVQLAEVEHKIQWLKAEVKQTANLLSTPSSPPSPSFPPCPLCDRPLDEHHWNLVLEKHQIRYQDILEKLWVIREQLAVSEREIQVLRQEYRQVDQEMTQYSSVLQQWGQLQEQLQATTTAQSTLQQIVTEIETIEQTLENKAFAAESQEELQLITLHLQHLNYDEKDHALARGEVDRWRWAEIRLTDIKQAKRRQAEIAQQQPELQAELEALQDVLNQLALEATEYLTDFEHHITELGYDPEQHTVIQAALRQAQPWQLQYQELGRAKQSYAQIHQRVDELAQAFEERKQELVVIYTNINTLLEQLQKTPDCQSHIEALEQQMQQQRSRLDDHLAQLGRLQQQQHQLQKLSKQHVQLSNELQKLYRQQRIYQELVQAFGKNGIPALMIENVLPQLEAETNQILSRLSANQLHVQFVTQRANRTLKSKTQNSKWTETLDILIADARGTRPYETYSGGEAFRVNFAIRLALAKLLAQRSGTALQMLIVDEGFGTQDAEGCDRLIAAINAIASDFACILAVTHVPHFKEAFQSRIEVFKTEGGSQLHCSM
jgi:exonuclease SbcC